jgi:hypothetical protein
MESLRSRLPDFEKESLGGTQIGAYTLAESGPLLCVLISG